MKEIKIHSIRYSPGYGDMLGEHHDITLKKDINGSWTYVSSDREVYDGPTVTSIYSVSDDALAQFEEFISKKKILSLSDRPKSDLFVTDYSPWDWNIYYDMTSFGETRQEYCSIADPYGMLQNIVVK